MYQMSWAACSQRIELLMRSAYSVELCEVTNVCFNLVLACSEGCRRSVKGLMSLLHGCRESSGKATKNYTRVWEYSMLDMPVLMCPMQREVCQYEGSCGHLKP